MLRSEVPRKHKGAVCIDAVADITERKDECPDTATPARLRLSSKSCAASQAHFVACRPQPCWTQPSR